MWTDFRPALLGDVLKRVLRKLVSSQALGPLWSPLASRRVSIFLLHRFAMRDLDVPGHDPTLLRQTLERFRRERVALLSLSDVIDRLEDPAVTAGRAVAFTVDDGYADFATIGADAFLAYDCPVTVFVTTGFADGQLWHWWDQIELICKSTNRRSAELQLGNHAIRLDLGTDSACDTTVGELWAACKSIPDSEKWNFIARLAAAAQVELPSQVPERYAPMSWCDVRALEARGIRFGPHSVTHPILSRVSDQDSAREIRGSWEALKRQVDAPAPFFAYPNGSPGDYGPREFDLLRGCGFAAAFTINPRHATSRSLAAPPDGRYELPRFPYPGDPDRAWLIATGFTRITTFLTSVGRRDERR